MWRAGRRRAGGRRRQLPGEPVRSVYMPGSARCRIALQTTGQNTDFRFGRRYRSPWPSITMATPILDVIASQATVHIFELLLRDLIIYLLQSIAVKFHPERIVVVVVYYVVAVMRPKYWSCL